MNASRSRRRLELRVGLSVSLASAICLSFPFIATAEVQRKQLRNGLELTSSGTVIQITALRDDILRVRAGQNGRLAEDASWAVLPDARSAEVSVQQDSNGFHTSVIRLQYDSSLRLTISDSTGSVLQQDSEPISWNGTAVNISKRKSPDDHFFGLGDKAGPLDRTGQSFVMWNTDTFGWQESTDPMYKSIPFFIEFQAGHALGVLFDNTYRSWFDFGHKIPGAYSFGASNGPVDYYVLYGPSPRKVVENYAWLTGPTPLPPLWSLGYQQSRYSYYPESHVREIANTLRADHIPADAVYLDIDYQDKNRPFTTDPVKFPHFAQLVADLAKQNLHLVTITDLHIAKVADPAYPQYAAGTAEDHFVKNPDGTVYTGIVWPGPAVFPDFTRKVTRDWWGSLFKDFAAEGVAGFWNDMNEPAIFGRSTKTMPDDIEHRIEEPGFHTRTATHLEIHNVYGMQNSRATYEGLVKLLPDVRPFVLTRASYAGGQRYAATWTGDNSATWNHLRMTVPQLENLGLSGFALSGADVGGFAGSPSPDLLTKWIELAAFQPVYRNHSNKGTRDHEPWVDGPDNLAIRRHFIEERYRLMPYIYTTAEEMSRTGVPIMRPVFLQFPNATSDGHPFDLDAPGEFLFGPDLLVASPPTPEDVSPYIVHLPLGIWYDYWTGERANQTAQPTSRDPEQGTVNMNRAFLVTPTLAGLPIYVRGGSIIPFAPLTESTDQTPQGPLTLRVYPGPECSGDVYADDGKSFAFRAGDYLRLHVTCNLNTDNSLNIHVDQVQGRYNPWWQQIRFEIEGWKPSVGTLESAGAELRLQRSGQRWFFTAPFTRTTADFTLR